MLLDSMSKNIKPFLKYLKKNPMIEDNKLKSEEYKELAFECSFRGLSTFHHQISDKGVKYLEVNRR